MQARVRAITEIVAELQRGVKEGRDVNLNAIKRDVCSHNNFTLCQNVRDGQAAHATSGHLRMQPPTALIVPLGCRRPVNIAWPKRQSLWRS